ncbi:MAG: antirestriction protein ArdA, partial [Hyphomonas oceanitis]|uniref:antirestriction protein ArdA n=1 Tax=Hyphomonas oceanitis TaxID=81033 RepID=UPI0030029330
MDTNATAAPAVPCRVERPRIYVACLAAYNGGRLHGRWIDATEHEAVWKEVRAMLAASPEPDAEEWAIHGATRKSHLLSEAGMPL